jgi:phage-related protein
VSEWRVIFFPPSGENNSPYDYIRDLSDASEEAQIWHRLDVMSKLKIGDWSHRWIHKIVDKIFQLSAGDNRLMFCLDEGAIIVLHACRKGKRKTRRVDIQKAQSHYDEYMSQKEGVEG